ncbi:heterokaryon incompatibility protein-domain-containing protein [Fusarium avenaceum]|nr:heterokaryon incompatibility protein-domain-containing protein [Fusarium avenaceum]
MLQYLRPQRGYRPVWIDTICINQANTHERNEQVQMMGQIYSQCNQVLLWLGADLVRPTPGTYPSRLPLQNTSLGIEISVAGKPTTLANILNRRYFSRVWVVQELILAPRVVMPVGNTTFFAHPRTERGFPVSRDNDPSRASSQIPWMEHITRGRVEARGLYEVVGLLGTSQASDARDKVFGVLGLLPSRSDLAILRPDYSLSQKSVFIGFVARSIFVEGNHFLLHQACGIVGSLDFPSWAPSYHHLETAWYRVLDKAHTGQPMQETVRRLIGATAVKTRSEDHRNLKKVHLDDWELLPNRIVSIGYGGEELVPGDDITGHGLHARLHSDTGRLSINLKRLFAIRKAPVPINIQLLQGCRIPSKTKGSCASPCVYLIGPKALHTIVRVGDEVWILETSATPKLFLVLRKNGESQTFSLITTCYYVFWVSYELVRKQQPWIPKKEINHEDSVFFPVSKMQKQMRSDYAYIRKMFNEHFQIDRTTCRHFLRFVMRASEENGYKVPRLPRRWQSLPERWEELYISSLQSDVESWIDEDYCYVEMRQGSRSLAQFKCMGWEFVTRGESTTCRRGILQIEKEYEMMLSSPKINGYLRVCLSICRRTYGDYALRDIDILTLEKIYGYKDGWDRWLGVTDETFKSSKAGSFMFNLSSVVRDDSPIRDFETDGSQYRVTIV